MYPSENIEAITKFLFIEDEKLIPADLVIVLCNHNISGTSVVINDLHNKGIIHKNSKIVLSGNYGDLDKGEEPECKRLYKELKNKYNLDLSNIILEDKSTNTYENLLFTKNIIKDFSAYNNILIIGAVFALRRMKMCATKNGYPIDKIEWTGSVYKENRVLDKHSWWKTKECRDVVFEEIEKIGRYLQKGHLDI